MNRDELLDQLYATRRQLTTRIALTAQQSVDQTDLEALVTERDRVVWLINRFIVSDVTASLAQTEQAIQSIRDATRQLSNLEATAKDLAKAVEIAKTIVTVAGALVGALA